MTDPTPKPQPFPRYFKPRDMTHPIRGYVRCDAPDRCFVVTTGGESPVPMAAFDFTILTQGLAWREIFADEAAALVKPVSPPAPQPQQTPSAAAMREALELLQRSMLTRIGHCCGEDKAGKKFCEAYGCGTLAGFLKIIDAALASPVQPAPEPTASPAGEAKRSTAELAAEVNAAMDEARADARETIAENDAEIERRVQARLAQPAPASRGGEAERRDVREALEKLKAHIRKDVSEDDAWWYIDIINFALEALAIPAPASKDRDALAAELAQCKARLAEVEGWEKAAKWYAAWSEQYNDALTSIRDGEKKPSEVAAMALAHFPPGITRADTPPAELCELLEPRTFAEHSPASAAEAPTGSDSAPPRDRTA